MYCAEHADVACPTGIVGPCRKHCGRWRVWSGRGSNFRHGRGVFGASGGGSGDCGFAFEVGGTDGCGALRKGKARPVFAIPDKESRTKSGSDCGRDSCRDQTYCASGYSGVGSSICIRILAVGASHSSYRIIRVMQTILVRIGMSGKLKWLERMLQLLIMVHGNIIMREK